MGIDWSLLKFSKGKPRVIERRAKVRDEKKEEAAAKQAVWKRCAGKCESCGKRIRRGAVDSLDAGHIHHRVYRSKGGTWDLDNLRAVCAVCHAGIHARGKKR